MPTIKEMQIEWPNIGFEERCIDNKDALIILYNDKYVISPFTDNELALTIKDFKDRILDPSLNAIEAKIKQENKNA